MIGAVSFVGQSPFAIPAASVSVTVDASATLATGGALDWHGRPYVVRRPDGVIVMCYRSGTSHFSNDAVIHIRFSDDNGATWTADDTTLGGDAVSGFPMTPPVGNIMIGEGMPFYAPNGDLLIHIWSYTGTWNVNAVANGTYQSRSTDGGETWSTPAGPINFGGLTDAQDLRTWATDQAFILDGVIYAGARVYADDAAAASAVILVTSEDNGATWASLSLLVSATDLGSEGTQEVGVEYIGDDTFLAIIRDVAAVTHTYQKISTDRGATWGSLTDVTSAFGVTGRHKLYTRARLRGQANPEKDPVLVCYCFEHQTPGSSLSRRPVVFVSRDRGTTWDGPNYLDTTTDDGGYGDIFHRTGDEYTVLTYRGTINAADLKQYDVTIAGI